MAKDTKKTNTTKKTSATKKTNTTKKTNSTKKVQTNSIKETKVEKNNKVKEIKKVDTKSIKEESKKIDLNGTKQNDMQKIMVIVFIIIGVFSIFYFIVFILNKKNYDNIFKPGSLGNAEIQYDEILVGTILKQSPSTYYVLASREEDKNLTIYNNIIDEYNYYEYEYKIYTVNLDNVFNKKNLADIESFDKENLKFKGTTLLKIEDKKVNEVYEDPEDIEDTLNNLLDDIKDKD